MELLSLDLTVSKSNIGTTVVFEVCVMDRGIICDDVTCGVM